MIFLKGEILLERLKMKSHVVRSEQKENRKAHGIITNEQAEKNVASRVVHEYFRLPVSCFS